MNHNPYTDPVECPECGRQYERTDWDGTTPCPSDDCPSHELPMAPDVLEDLYSPEGDGEHPLYPRSAWREQVANEYTISGYWVWVSHMLLNE